MSLDEATQLGQLQRGLVLLYVFTVVGFCFLLISVSPFGFAVRARPACIDPSVRVWALTKLSFLDNPFDSFVDKWRKSCEFVGSNFPDFDAGQTSLALRACAHLPWRAVPGCVGTFMFN